ncbi:MAG TPA: YciI family protein [Woeseiaceae bacterium]|nr:YciI family protein [Woeseiaceae bacterium]
MKVMVFVKATEGSEAGEMPSQQLISDMMAFNEELVKAGIMLAGDGLKPSSAGARVRFSGKNRTVIDGPFAETKELVAGYWLWEVESMQEAIDWVKRCPNPMTEESDIEIRPLFAAEDFGEAMTPELRDDWKRLQAESERLAKK